MMRASAILLAWTCLLTIADLTLATDITRAASTCVEAVVATEKRCLNPGDRFKDCADCPEMVIVPAGTFLMGSPDSEERRVFSEGPQHQVTIVRPFAVGRFEVTFAEWDACTAEGRCKKVRDPGWGRGRQPVVNISWEDVTNEFLPWLSEKTGSAYRLLSESEWEYAARAGTTTPFSTGMTISTGDADYDGTSTYGSGKKGVFRQAPLAVGSFAPNAFGLHDMHGNVAEWVADCYFDSYTGAPADGSARTGHPDCSRLLRGGSWFDAPRALRSAYRGHVFANSRFIYRGFRVARAL